MIQLHHFCISTSILFHAHRPIHGGGGSFYDKCVSIVFFLEAFHHHLPGMRNVSESEHRHNQIKMKRPEKQ